MAAAKNNGQTEEKITALYCRLSVDDMKDGKADESNSITNQKQILQDYCAKMGYYNTMTFADDGISGTTFNRPDFLRMERMIEDGLIGRVIVKDLSRFGREQVEMGRLTQVVYPSLGVEFISLQENVNTMTGDGMEMMPFYNIFNEWYAAQTSKKIRQVWQTKSEHGKRVSPTVPFGYVKDSVDKEVWHIDEPAAQVVRYIYSLCLAGKGPLQIAKQLEREKIMVPTAYYDSIGRTHGTRSPANIYHWETSSVMHILENRQYTGCAVNFKTTTVSYKVHKTIYNDKENYVIIPNKQEPIISEEDWLRVQELREHRRRNTATGKQSLFSGLLYCADCGAKLHFCAAKNLKHEQEFYRCANYKDGRGSCRIHYIRNVVLEEIVLEAISSFADFVRCYEPVFLYMAAKKNAALKQDRRRELQRDIDQGEKRIKIIDRLIEKLYEEHALGDLSDERYKRMMVSYETEQRELISSVAKWKNELDAAEQETVDLRKTLSVLRSLTDIKELSPELVNTLIKRIEVHDNEQRYGRGRVKVDIYFTAVGLMDIPTEKEILTVMAEMQSDKAAKQISA